MSDYLTEKKTEEFIQDCTDERYISSEYGYCPHIEQTRATCPRCGHGVFESYAQTVVLSAKVWAHEYSCAKCHWTLAIEVSRE